MRKPTSANLSIRLPEEEREKLDKIASATGRTKSYLAAQAIQEFISAQSWQIEAIQEAIHLADQPNAEFMNHSDVAQWLSTWGAEEDLE